MNPTLLKKDSPFELCSDRIARMFPEYEVDLDGRFHPGPDTNTINFNTLKELLLSDASVPENQAKHEEFKSMT